MNEWLNSGPTVLEWIPIERPIDAPSYAKERVGQWKRIGVEVAVHTVQIGGRTNYESDVATKSELITGDVIRELAKECQKAGIKLIVGWNGTIHATRVEVTRHPDWQMRHLDGTVEPWTCFNSPYREFLAAQIEELVRKYPVHGIYFDQVSVGCFCNYCKQHYLELYGEPMPLDSIGGHPPRGNGTIYPQPGNAATYKTSREIARRLQRLAMEQRTSWAWNVRRILDATRPGLVFVVNQVMSSTADQVRDYVDAFLPEINLGMRSDLNAISAERALTRVYGRKPIWEIFSYSMNNQRVHAIHQPFIHGGEILTTGNNVVLLEHGTLTDRPPAVRAEFEKAFKQFAGVLKRRAGLKPRAYAGILHSKSSWTWSLEQTDRNYQGASQLCVENHIPFLPISEEDVVAGGLDVRVILVPEAAVLSAEVIQGLAKFCRAGGGIIVTGRSGEMDSNERPRTDSELDRLLGIKRLCWRSGRRFSEPLWPNVPIDSEHMTNFKFARIREADHPAARGVQGALTHFNLGYVEFEPVDAQVVASVVGFDQTIINAAYFNRSMARPGKVEAPLAAVNATGRGRTAYFAAPLFNPAVREDGVELTTLLLNSLKWCGGDLEVDVGELPRTTKIAVWGGSSEGRMLVVLRSQAVETILEAHGAGGSKLLKDGAPTPAGSIRLHAGKKRPSSWTSLTGSDIQVDPDGDWIVLSYPAFDRYEAVEIEFGTVRGSKGRKESPVRRK